MEGCLKRVVAIVAVGAVCATAWSSAPQARAADTSSVFGVSPATATNAKEMRRLADGGAGAARFALNWSVVQPQADGPFDWLSIDYFVLHATRNGINPVPKLLGSPRYAAYDLFRPPIDTSRARKRWQRFVRAAVERYGTTGPGSFWDGVHNCLPGSFCDPNLPIRPLKTWQIWNEPNMKLFWKPLPSVGEYAALLRLSEDAIHDVDPRAQVLTGGITPGGGKYGPPGTEFLADLYASAPDAASLFDAVAIHPYAAQPAEVIGIVEETREVMNLHGDGATPLWITEFGWATGGPPDSEQVVTLTEQADRIGEVMETLSQRRARYGLQTALAYTDHDFQDATSPCQWCPSAGLMFADGSPKPAWLRFSAIAHATPDAAPRLLSSVNSSQRVVSIARGKRRKTDDRVTTTVERYGDGSAIVEMNSDDVRLNHGSWRLTSCLRFLAGQRSGPGDQTDCDQQKLRIKSRGNSFAPGDQLAPLTRAELSGDPYASHTSAIGYIEARKRVKGKWRTRLTSLPKRAGGISLR